VLALTPSIGASVDFDQTRFSAGDGQLLQAGAQLANSLRKVCMEKRGDYVKYIYYTA
jgi:hypothetical protein